jgi:tetratricopeptide (TPR) repeat protein
MRMSWRKYCLLVLVGIWPHLGCHQIPGDKSVQDLRPIQQKAPDQKQEITVSEITQPWIAKADKLDKEGRTAEAVALCEKMREPGNPETVTATKKIALIYDRSHDLVSAEQEYQKLLQLNSKDAEALYKLGDISYRRGHWFTAEKHLRSALAQQPNHVAATVCLGMTLAQQGKRDSECIEVLKKVVSTAEAYCSLGFVLALQGKPQEAIVAYETALKHEPRMQRASAELSKLRQGETASTVTITTPYRPGLKGTAELESASSQTAQTVSRQSMLRPTLPPLPDLDPVTPMRKN